MWEKVPESLSHVLVGCLSQVQTEYMDRYNATLKVLRDLKLHRHCTVPFGTNVYQKLKPKPKPKLTHKLTDAKSFWDVLVYAKHTFVRST